MSGEHEARMRVETTATHPVREQAVASSRRPTAQARPGWIDQARDSLAAGMSYLAYEDSGRHVITPLAPALTRIGRSVSAEVHFDDASVSRRHAVISCRPDATRIFDDRSLNGVYVNDVRVDSSILRDGDRIGIGRHVLWFLDAPATAAVPPAGERVAVAG